MGVIGTLPPVPKHIHDLSPEMPSVFNWKPSIKVQMWLWWLEMRSRAINHLPKLNFRTSVFFLFLACICLFYSRRDSVGLFSGLFVLFLSVPVLPLYSKWTIPFFVAFIRIIDLYNQTFFLSVQFYRNILSNPGLSSFFIFRYIWWYGTSNLVINFAAGIFCSTVSGTTRYLKLISK